MGREVRPLLLARLVPLLLLALLTYGEHRLFVGKLQQNPDEVAFVLANVHGILTGNPVWKSSQHRVLGPLVVAALEQAAPSPRHALSWAMGLGLIAQNALLFCGLRRSRVKALLAIAVVATFGLLHWLTLYKLEYPWDWLDAPLFTAFGYWAAARGAPKWLLVFLLLGVVNHETVLYVPLWLALAAFDPRANREQKRREEWLACASFVLSWACIFALREVLYQGPPDLSGYVAERATPWLENPIHLRHNWVQFWRANWSAGRAWISLSVLGVMLACGGLLVSNKHARAAVWSLAVLFTIFCFGYVNETRLYLPLLAFWFGYAGARRGIGQTPAACTTLPNTSRPQAHSEANARKTPWASTCTFRIACRSVPTATF
jgi:hypothetical protein